MLSTHTTNSIATKNCHCWHNIFTTCGIVCVIVVIISSCKDANVPKPYGYYRIDLPKHSYTNIDTLNLPFKFDKPANVLLIKHKIVKKNIWFDLYYPQLDANIYCSCMPVKENLGELSEDARKVVYKHSIRADGIGERAFDNAKNNVHGILYDLKGNTASSLQFVLTDSTKNFFRAVLYFNTVPNKDSLAPAINYIREDVIRIMESFTWRKK